MLKQFAASLLGAFVGTALAIFGIGYLDLMQPPTQHTRISDNYDVVYLDNFAPCLEGKDAIAALGGKVWKPTSVIHVGGKTTVTVSEDDDSIGFCVATETDITLPPVHVVDDKLVVVK